MNCPHCQSRATSQRKQRTALGYQRFSCRCCRRRFNERTGTPFNDLQFPTDIVLLAVLWRLRYKLGFRDVAELLLHRGYEVTHETVRAWEYRFAPLLAERLRSRRRGQGGCRSWYLDETYVKVSGHWRYLYRAIDRDGNLLDSMLSEQRDRSAARLFLRRLLEVTTDKPLRLTTDRHPAYGKAIRWILGRKVLHRQSQYLNNRIEQDHRPIKQRYYPMLGFGRMESAKRFCSAFEELRQYLRIRPRLGERVSLSEKRRTFLARWQALMTAMTVA
jgi:putative transposase